MGAYVQQPWDDYPATTTPIEAAQLAHMEAGISNADPVSGLVAVPPSGGDDTAAIQAALDSGSSVALVGGDYTITAPLTVPTKTRLFGWSAEWTVINLDTSFPHTTVSGAQTMGGATGWTLNVASTTGFPSSGVIQVDGRPVVYSGKTGTSFTGCNNNPPNTALANGDVVGTFAINLGDPHGGDVYRCQLQSIGIDCQNVAGSSGVYSCRCNEQSGGEDLLIRNYQGIALEMETALDPATGTAQNWNFRKMHVIASSTAPATVRGIDVNVNGAGFRGIEDCTVTCAGGTTLPAGSIAVQLNGATGIEIANAVGCYGCVLINVGAGPGVGSLVHISGNFDYAGTQIFGLRNQGGAATYTLKNDDSSHVLATADSVIGYYQVGRTYTITTDA